MRGPVGAAALVVAGFTLGCAGASAGGPTRQTVETRITVNGEFVVLRWSDRHPWDAELVARGALLAAEYRTGDGAVALDCLGGAGPPPAAGRPDRRRAGGRTPACLGLAGEVERTREDRSLRFRLPEATTATPAGPVCLYFQLADQRVLPVRRADREGVETARFRYPDWEAAASNEAELRSLQARTEQLRAAVAVKAEDIATQEAINARNGWTSRSGCDGIQPPDVGAGPAERPLAEPAEREAVARRVCMMRVWYADSLLTGRSLPERLQRPVAQPPGVVDRLLGMLPAGEVDAARRAQAAAFRRDWERLAPGMRAYRDGLGRDGWPNPHFGSFGDQLRLQSITFAAAAQVAQALARGERPDATQVAGVSGGMLEAYDRCVADGRQQLATSYRAAMDLREREPLVRESIRRSLVRDCHGGLDKLEALRAEHASLTAQLREAEAALAALPEHPALPARTQDLNTAVCRP